MKTIYALEGFVDEQSIWDWLMSDRKDATIDIVPLDVCSSLNPIIRQNEKKDGEKYVAKTENCRKASEKETVKHVESGEKESAIMKLGGVIYKQGGTERTFLGSVAYAIMKSTTSVPPNSLKDSPLSNE